MVKYYRLGLVMTKEQLLQQIREFDQLVKFLLGEDTFQGKFFDEAVYYGRTRARYWWRSNLRRLWSQVADELLAKDAEIDALVAAFRKRMPDDEWLNMNYPVNEVEDDDETK